MNLDQVVTKSDIAQFRAEILELMQNMFSQVKPNGKKWLKSNEVQELLNISSSGLQNLRIKNIIPYTKIGGTIYYDVNDINKILEQNKRNN